MAKVFIDSNVLLYAIDVRDKKKRTLARKRLVDLQRDGQGVLSTQVLQEFFVISTRKMGVDPLFAKRIIESLEHYEVVLVNAELIKSAIDLSILNQLSFWDGLIVSAAASANCSELWSEDLNDGQVIKGIRVRNPFKGR